MPVLFLTYSRHKTVFYFRRRIPTDLQTLFKNRLLLISLNTYSKKKAVILARNLASKTDYLFDYIRDMNNKKNDLTASYTLYIELNEQKQPVSIKIDAEPHETEAVQSVIATTLSLENSELIQAPRKPSTPAFNEPTRPFQEYIDEYLQKANLKPSTIANYKSKLRFAKEHFGDDSNLLEVSQKDFVAFSEYVKSKIPNNTTQGLYIQIINTFMNWHRLRHGISTLNSSTLIPPRKVPEQKDREPHTLNDMKVIIENAFKYSRRQPYKWWATIAVALSGCRLEEICQVNLKTDLQYDKEADIWFLKLDEYAEEDGSTKKSLKKLASWRNMPIHSALVKIGFISYLQAQLKAGVTRPFELGWKPYIVEKEGIHKWSQYASKWGGRELTKLSKKGLIKVGNKTYFHSMRHTVAQLLLEADVSPEIREAIAGRNAGYGEQERYGKIKDNYVLQSRKGIEISFAPLVEILESTLNIKL